MNRIYRLSAFLILFIVSVNLSAQDVSSPYKWNISAKKIGEGKYELSFSTNGAQGWQLYSPMQPDTTFNAALLFGDSAIAPEKNFTETGTVKISNDFLDSGRIYEGSTEWKKIITITGVVPAKLQGKLTYNYGKGAETLNTGNTTFQVALEGGIDAAIITKIPSIDIKNPVNDCGDDLDKDKSLMGIFILGLLGGFIALLTPCVFPMIPLTVSFFTKQSQSKKKGVVNAMTYGFFIFLIYVLLSLPFHAFNASPQVLNNISTSVWLNLFFFVIFIVFAISFFGYFEITLPGALANRAGSKSGLSIFGIFFMAFTLAIVSFSCTGPILGTLLVSAISSSGGPMQLTFGMAGFGLGLALPFTVFAIFPNWLQSIPKSGGWLNSVKVVLGFLEVAMAIKFLSNADLVKQWGLVKREVFIGLWVLCGIGIVLYLLGRIRFPHDSPVKKFSRWRIAFIVLFAAMTFYLIPGVSNTKWANLKLISGFPPPMCYSIYKEPVNCKRGFEPLRDYEAALQRARKENKPVLIDFTGWACVNCRRMEEAVWTDPLVDSLMRNQFVVVSLYVDEKTKLPIQQRTTYKTENGKEEPIITIGDRWANFQIANFYASVQPQYAIISTEQIALTKTKAYTPNPNEFADWLRCGLDAFQKTRK